ncbi:mRNA-decapping enzyme subunit 2 [Maudiozyma exigua]|uniref:mRNA-decapping enzyme subunit 2 n=1 Tax=Maudiozyma exigua TaxID=34358 RepID=A0A9P6WCD8_MAUEX|nr:mRNA-decapping enzyme subunit 2 [Kazachstania exigua]
MSLPLRHGLENVTSIDRIIEDLLVRFIINCPPEDLSSVERELFHFEEASWFYTDFIKLMNPNLPKLKIKQLSQLFIKLCPLVWKWKDIKVDQALSKFSKYKKTIPVRGAAIFNKNMTKILLVKGTESDSWSFPRGKISKDEDDISCCIREVKEEIGFDLADYLDEDQFIERNISGKNYKIFLVNNIPEDTVFRPLARNEIEKIQWFDFKKVSRALFKNNNSNKFKFYLINSMIRPLSMWAKHQRQNKNETQLKSQAEEQLKVLLGITKEEQLDPGRELLNMLQFSNGNNGNVQPQQEVPVQQNNNILLPPVLNGNMPNRGQFQQFPPMAQPQSGQLSPQREQHGMMPPGFQPFAPYPFVNKMNGVPFNQMMRPMFSPQQQQNRPMQGPPSHPMTPQNSNVPMLHPQQPTEQEIPSANSLSKPSFVPSSNDNSRILLSVLNSAPQAAPQNKRTADSTTLLNLPHRNPVTRETNFSNDSSRAVSNDHSRAVSNVTSESTNPELPSPSFSSPDIKQMARKATNNPSSSDDLDYTDFEESTDSEVEEDLQDLENESDGPVRFVNPSILKENIMKQGEIPHADNRSDSVASIIDETIRSPTPFSEKSLPQQKSIETLVAKPKKFKILKRGEAIPSAQEEAPPVEERKSSLMYLLRKPNVQQENQPNNVETEVKPANNKDDTILDHPNETHSIAEQGVTSEKSSRRESNVDTTNNELLNMLRKNSNVENTQDAVIEEEDPVHQAPSGHDLLNILKTKPRDHSNISDISPTNSTLNANMTNSSGGSDLLQMLKKSTEPNQPTFQEPFVSGHSLNQSNRPFGELPIERVENHPTSTTQRIQDTSNELLGMLKRNTTNDHPHKPAQIPENQSHNLLNTLKNPGMNNNTNNNQHFQNPSLQFDGTQFNTSPPPGMPMGQNVQFNSNDLMAMLNNDSRQNQNFPGNNNTAQQGNSNASAHLLSMLHK